MLAIATCIFTAEQWYVRMLILFANPLYQSLHEGKLPKWSNCSAGLIGKLIAGLGRCLPLLQVATLNCSKELGVWSQQRHSLHLRGTSCSLAYISNYRRKISKNFLTLSFRWIWYLLCGIPAARKAGCWSCGLGGEEFLSFKGVCQVFMLETSTFSGVCVDGKFWRWPSAKGTAGYLLTEAETSL